MDRSARKKFDGEKKTVINLEVLKKQERVTTGKANMVPLL